MNTNRHPQEHYEILGLHREIAIVQDVVEAANRLGQLLHPSNDQNDPAKSNISIVAFRMVSFTSTTKPLALLTKHPGGDSISRARGRDLWKRIRYDNIDYPRIRPWRRNFARRDAMDIFNDEVGRFLANEREKTRIEKEQRDTWIFGEKVRRIKEAKKKQRVEEWRRAVLDLRRSRCLGDGPGNGSPMGQSGLAGSKWANAPEHLPRHDAVFETKNRQGKPPRNKGAIVLNMGTRCRRKF